MHHRIVPGHASACTLWLVASLVIVALIVSWFGTIHWMRFAGAILIVTGAFIADQATHLAQPAHEESAPTPLERLLQRYRWPAVAVGLMVANVGVVLVIV